MNRKQSKTSALICKGAVTSDRALELRIANNSYREIAQILGISYQAAQQAVKRKLDKLESVSEEKALELRHLESERLDQMQKALWEKATNPDKPDKRAAEVILKIMDHRAKLFGLYAARNESLSVNSEGNVEQINIVFVKPQE